MSLTSDHVMLHSNEKACTVLVDMVVVCADQISKAGKRASSGLSRSVRK